MKQEQGWFDQNNTYQFSTLVQSQIKTIEAGLGDELGNVLMSVSMFVAGMVVAFTTSWKLTLVLFSILPLMALGVFLLRKQFRMARRKLRMRILKRVEFPKSVLYQIKTVASFANFNFEIEKYNCFVDYSRDIAIRNGLKHGLGVGFIFFVLFTTYCLAIWFGSTRSESCCVGLIWVTRKEAGYWFKLVNAKAAQRANHRKNRIKRSWFCVSQSAWG